MVARRPGRTTEEPIFVAGRNGVRYPEPTHAQAFLGLVRAGVLLERRLDLDLRRGHGISLRGYEILLHLATFSPDGDLPMTQLIKQAPLSQSQVSRLVSELEAQGFVERTADDRDSRAVHVAITGRGLDALREAQATHHRGLDEGLYSRLTSEEVRELASITTKILDADTLVPARPGSRRRAGRPPVTTDRETASVLDE